MEAFIFIGGYSIWGMKMPNECKFTVIYGDQDRLIGDRTPRWSRRFNAPGCDYTKDAVLMFMIKGLTHTESSVKVYINNDRVQTGSSGLGLCVGEIFPYTGADLNIWFTQIIHVRPRTIDNGENELQIEAESYPGHTAENFYDDFRIRDIVCFYKE